jgi:thioredoxin reductase (NADPH)
LDETFDLLIVGGGPAGLAVAIAAHQAGLRYVVVEKGVLVNSIFFFPRQMVFFTTPDLLEIGGLPFVTPYEKPTGAEALKYYRRVSDTYEIELALGEEVTSLRAEDQGFSVTTLRGADEAVTTRRAAHVALATGYYDHPNALGVPGEDLPHVSHYWTEAHPFYRRRVVVVGGKNSAAIAALELYRAGAEVTLVHRGERIADSVKYWIKPDIENRIKEGAVKACFDTRLVEIRPDAVVLERDGVHTDLPADAVFLLTGYTPDVALLREAGAIVDPETLVPVHDAESFETSVPGLFVAGALASGRFTSRIFIENGRFHGEAIVGAITARRASEGDHGP